MPAVDGGEAGEGGGNERQGKKDPSRIGLWEGVAGEDVSRRAVAGVQPSWLPEMMDVGTGPSCAVQNGRWRKTRGRTTAKVERGRQV